MVASAADKPLLEGGYYPGQEDNAALKFPPVKVDRVVGEGDKITIPDTVGKGRAKRDLTLVAHMTPGHYAGLHHLDHGRAREEMESHRGVLLQRDGGREQAGRQARPIPASSRTTRRRSARRSGIIADVFLAPHPEMFKMEDKRPLIGKYGVNPFVKAGEFHAFVRDAEKAFDEGLAKQKAAVGSAASKRPGRLAKPALVGHPAADEALSFTSGRIPSRRTDIVKQPVRGRRRSERAISSRHARPNTAGPCRCPRDNLRGSRHDRTSHCPTSPRAEGRHHHVQRCSRHQLHRAQPVATQEQRST